MSNYPDGMTRSDLIYVGEISPDFCKDCPCVDAEKPVLIDERQADTVTITISRDYAKNMATWEPNWSIGFYDELCEVTEACRAALKETE